MKKSKKPKPNANLMAEMIEALKIAANVLPYANTPGWSSVSRDAEQVIKKVIKKAERG